MNGQRWICTYFINLELDKKYKCPQMLSTSYFSYCSVLNVFVDGVCTNQAYFFVHEATVHLKVSFSANICMLYIPGYELLYSCVTFMFSSVPFIVLEF